MDIATTILLIGAVATATIAGVAALPWRGEELDETTAAVRALIDTLGGVVGSAVVAKPVGRAGRRSGEASPAFGTVPVRGA